MSGRRVLRGLAAGLALLIGLVGLPVALVWLGGNPLPAQLDWAAVRDALLTPDDGSVLFGLVTVVGWLAWVVFAASVMVELVALASRRRVEIRLPGLGPVQRLAAGLLIAVVAMLATPHVAHAPPGGPTTTAAAPVAYDAGPAAPASSIGVASGSDEGSLARAEPSRPTEAAPPAAGGSGHAPGTTHRVSPGDDLWSLAERYYGEGREWRRIAAANPQLLSGGPDRLQPGWELRVPHPRGGDAGATGTKAPVATVRPGETLSAIAERELGSARHWHRLYELNRHQLTDPNELPTGLQLLLPTPKASPASDVHPRVVDPSPSAPPGETYESGGVENPPPAGLPTTPVPPADPTPAVPPADPTPAGAPATSSRLESADLALPLAGVGGLLAAGLVAGLQLRRRLQMQARPVGRRIPHPSAPAQAVETAMGARQRPLTLRTLDRALRAIGAHCRATSKPLPELLFALVGDDEIELVLSQASADAPVAFTVRGRSWVLSQADAGYLSSVPGLAEAGRPWPALVTLGRDPGGRPVVADLEAFGILGVDTGSAAELGAVLNAMAVELSFSPWADELILTLVGDTAGLPDALGKHNVSRTDDLDGLTDRLERRAAVQREQPAERIRGERRIDPDLADPWAPEIVLINRAVSEEQRARLRKLVSAEPAVTLAIVLAGVGTPWTLAVSPTAGERAAVLEPIGLALTPQLLDETATEAVVELVATTGVEATTSASWWHDPASLKDRPPEAGQPPGSGADQQTDFAAEERGGTPVRVQSVTDVDHPTLQLLGPVELLGAAGDAPARAGKQCLEYCAWLLEHPGTTAQAMANALVIAEGTRRSNMSRLRGWLGGDADGNPYLPDAYTGRIYLDQAVTSDWQHVQVLTVGGVNRAGSDSLEAALHLVRGAPLADAAPGQWHWAEALRTDMISCVRDIGLELADRSLEAGNLDLARWAAARALVAAPADELLMATRIRTEHRAGNAPETERLTLQLAAQARALGVDLDVRTVMLLQEVMEGRVRARMV